MRPGVRLAVDVGSVRVGLAACDPAGVIASPLRTLVRDAEHDADVAEVAAEARERGAVEVVVGWPLSLDGSEGPAALRAVEYADKIRRSVPASPSGSSTSGSAPSTRTGAARGREEGEAVPGGRRPGGRRGPAAGSARRRACRTHARTGGEGPKARRKPRHPGRVGHGRRAPAPRRTRADDGPEWIFPHAQRGGRAGGAAAPSSCARRHRGRARRHRRVARGRPGARSGRGRPLHRERRTTRGPGRGRSTSASPPATAPCTIGPTWPRPAWSSPAALSSAASRAQPKMAGIQPARTASRSTCRPPLRSRSTWTPPRRSPPGSPCPRASPSSRSSRSWRRPSGSPRPTGKSLADPAPSGCPPRERQRRGVPLPGDLLREPRRERRGRPQGDGHAGERGADEPRRAARADARRGRRGEHRPEGGAQRRGHGEGDARPGQPDRDRDAPAAGLDGQLRRRRDGEGHDDGRPAGEPTRRTTPTCTRACRPSHQQPRRGRAGALRSVPPTARGCTSSRWTCRRGDALRPRPSRITTPTWRSSSST